MDHLFAELDTAVPAAGVLGYLNFSDGRPDPRWQKQVHDALAFFTDRGTPQPWEALHRWLSESLGRLRQEGTAAFRDVRQAETALNLYAQVLPAYRDYHADLLGHQTEDDLFQPFFLVRVFEAILAGMANNGVPEVPAVLQRLNDYVGYRPVAVLETLPRGEPYEHERHRPVPLYLRGAGVARGQYHDLVSQALDILTETDADLLAAAHFSLDQLEELAVDMRAYDHGHPANRRPNYVFGEWDPHQIDNKGRYRRYVARRITLDALLDRIPHVAPGLPGGADSPRQAGDDMELLAEAAAVLAGTILMAAGISGAGPTAHDSSATLAALMPGIARYRDEFYQQRLKKMSGPHAERLRREQAQTRQPFGAARQHLNGYLARHRAAQLQQRVLAVLFAEMGYAEASLEEARRIPAASVRLLSEILGRLGTGHREVEHGRLREAARLLPEVEGLLHRGIACGAFPDPWNVLGFQALFPLSPAQEDSVRDTRLDELAQVIEQTFLLYARLSSEAAAAGDGDLVGELMAGMRKLAEWWDRFATVEVGDYRRVHGEEAVTSAGNVASALARWHERGAAAADLTFWRRHLDNFHSPKAFALVADALLRKEDYRAAMALLVNWAGQAEQVSLEDGPHSFHNLSLRWLLGTTGASGPEYRDLGLAQKFFDYLEANAEEYWQVPGLEVLRPDSGEQGEGLYSAAYEDVTYKDTTAGDEGEVAGGEPREEFDLEEEGQRLERRLRFLSTVARLWQVAARAVASEHWSDPAAERRTTMDPAAEREAIVARRSATRPDARLTTDAWLATAGANLHKLLALMDVIDAHPVPVPSGDYESLVEYDRRRVTKEQLLYAAVGTCLDMTMAVGALTGARLAEGEVPAVDVAEVPHLADWGAQAIALERALFRGDAAAARAALAEFVPRFAREPLLLTTLADGGRPREVLRVRTAQAIVRVLLANLPRLGLLRESHELLKQTHAMEKTSTLSGRRVTEFNQFFQTGFLETVESVVESAPSWGPGFADRDLADLLERLTAPFLTLWVEHSRTVQISALEGLANEGEWTRVRDFIQRYGRDLFHPRFMTLGNLRGILHRGAPAYLDYLTENADPLRPVKLAEDLDRAIPKADAARRLEFVLHCLVENYEEYKDFNTTTSQSDYGENLYVLLDFLRLKAAYERHAWQFRPLVLVHEVLARRGRAGAAVLWEESLARLTADLAKRLLDRLAALERKQGMRLSTVSDRLHERFVKPLALDRLRALTEPAMAESRAGGLTPSFDRFRQEIREFAATPTGVGLDVPAWLRALEAEVHRAQATRSTLAVMAENFYRVPRRLLSLEDVRRQLESWK